MISKTTPPLARFGRSRGKDVLFMLRRRTTRGLSTKRRYALVVGVVIGSVCAFPAGALAKKGRTVSDPPCTLSETATGDLVASGSGLAASANYEFQVYSGPEASVDGGELATDATGSYSRDFGSLSFLMNVYPNETMLTVDVYPISGNRADMNTVVASCSTTL